MNREQKIKLIMVGDNQYEIRDFHSGELLANRDDDYCIYMKFVNLKFDGNSYVIEGRFLGHTDDRLIHDGSLYVSTQEEGFCTVYQYEKEGLTHTGYRKVRAARMVVVENKKRTVIVIEQE